MRKSAATISRMKSEGAVSVALGVLIGKIGKCNRRLRNDHANFIVRAAARSAVAVHRLRSPFTVWRSPFAGRSQNIGNTLGLKVTCFRVVGVCKISGIDLGFLGAP